MKLTPIHFDNWDKDGAILCRVTNGGDLDAYGATLYIYQELGVKVRNANGVLVGVSENF